MNPENVPVSNFGDENHLKLVRLHEVRSLLGQVLTIIDGIGLQEKQEKAVKDMIKRAFYGDFWQYQPGHVIYDREADELLLKAFIKAVELQDKNSIQSGS